MRSVVAGGRRYSVDTRAVCMVCSQAVLRLARSETWLHVAFLRGLRDGHPEHFEHAARPRPSTREKLS